MIFGKAKPTLFSLLIILLIGSGLPSGAMALTATLNVSQPPPRGVGTEIMLQTVVDGADPAADLRYRYDFSLDGGPWTLLSDFSTSAYFLFSRLDEGVYQLRTTVTDKTTQSGAMATIIYALTGQATGGDPVVVGTGHPLVALFSAAPCPVGSALRVRFWAQSDGPPGTATPFKTCDGIKSMNLLIAGMREDTDYVLLPQVLIGGTGLFSGTPIPFRTGIAPGIVRDYAVTTPAGSSTSTKDGVLLVGGVLREPATRIYFATDLAGNPIWYFDRVAIQGQGNGAFRLTNPVNGGTFLFIGTRDDLPGTLLQEVDLLGDVVRETNAEVVNEQLAAMGFGPMLAFHHEALRLDNGHTVALAYNERILTDIQGPGDVNVLGDMIIALDENFQVTWAWDAFDKLDITEMAVLGETCTPDEPGCPAFFSTEIANDWTHSNALGYSRADGNLVISVRHHDAVYKVDYADGAGTGDIVWRLGEGGDFQIVADEGEAYPWFSHQHDTHYEDGMFLVYDNGNTRQAQLGGLENSRAQAYVLDELDPPNLAAHLVGNFDLGSYNAAVGSIRRLSNGNFFATNGFINFGAEHEMLEITPSGARSWALGGPDIVYRGYRMYSLYWSGHAVLGEAGAGF